ncbi:MAG: ABC transporter substrate-binding protein [Burkholderiales bacterium]|nr:ABC transporter substrate-binding protein [Burkholderiales bacterium]
MQTLLTVLMRGSFLIAALLWAAVPAQADVEKKSVKITLDWAFQGPQSVFTLAEQRGYFQREGVSVTIDRAGGSGETIIRVASGAYDFGWADFATMVKYDATNPGQRLIGVYMSGDKSPNAVMAVKGRRVAKPKDLEGKTLGSTAGSAAHAMFPLFAGKVGVDPSTIQWKMVSGALREPMLARGEVDAVAGFVTSSVMSLVELGIPQENVIVYNYNDFGLSQYGTVLFAKASFVESNPKTVAAVVRAYNQALKDAIADPDASVATLKARDPLLNLDIECRRLMVGLNLTATPNFNKEGLSAVDPKRLSDSIDEIRRAFNFKEPIPNDSVYTEAFLPPRAERMPPPLGACKNK